MQIFLKKLNKNNNYYYEIYSDIWLGVKPGMLWASRWNLLERC